MKVRPNVSISSGFGIGMLEKDEVAEIPDDRPALLREMRLLAARGLVEIVEKERKPDYAEARRHVEAR